MKPPLAVEITDLSVVGRAAVGERFVVQVRYEAAVTGPGLVSINLPSNAVALGGGKRTVDGLAVLEVPVRLNANAAQGVVTFPLRVTAPGPLMIEAQVRALEVGGDYIPYAWRHLQIESRAGSATVRHPRAEGVYRRQDSVDATPEGANARISSRGDTPFLTSPEAAPEADVAMSSGPYRFNVSGRVVFRSSDDGNAFKGVYGAKIRLYLYRNGSYFQPVSGNTSGVHYVVVGEDGRFNFNFTYNGTISSTDQLVAFVSSATSTIRLMSDVGHTFYNEPYFTLPAWSKPLQGLGSNITIVEDAVIDSGAGAVLRYTTLAREAVDAAYNWSPPVSTAPRYAPNASDIYIEDLDRACGRYRISWSFFDYHRRLSIDPACTQIQTIPHEYGHWLHEALVGRDNFTDAEDSVTEGWAVFHSFATRGWANSRYGDDPRAFSDNPETAPWEVGSVSGQPTRFYNMKYARGGKPVIGAMASFLWAAYDGTPDQDRETAAYDAGDNEDLNGRPSYVYDALRLGPGDRDPDRPIDLRNAVLARTPSSLDPAVTAAYDFMFVSLTAVPSTPMRAVQVSSLSGQKLSATSARLTWATNVYPYSGSFVNRPTGYKVYRNGSLVATLSNTTTSYTYNNAGGVSGTYRVTAYNAAGESAAAPTTQIGLIASMTGPDAVFTGSQESWTADVTGGSGTTTYKWYRDGSYTGVTSQTYTAYPPASDFTLRVDVVRGGETASASMYVVVLGGGGCENGEFVCPQVVAAAVPEVFAVRPPQPNPSRGEATVEYDLPEGADVSVVVYDVTGREVARIVDGFVTAGYHEAQFNGAALPSGVYVVRVTAGAEAATQRLTVVR